MSCGVCLLKTLFSPFILVAQAIWIYVFGCMGVYVDRLGRGLFCGLCVCCRCTYKDKSFPPSSHAIGAWKGKSPQQIDQEVIWKRVKDVCARSSQQGAKLFSGGINANDICQGQLGDCWLMSACACLATQEGAIQRCFLTQEYTAYGRYRIKLFDGLKQQWRTVVVDDWVPCSRQTGHAVFAKPAGDEAWVLLLEKAMAKFKGTYAALDGGSTMWALEALTGDYVFKFKLEDMNGKASWLRLDMVHPRNPGEGLMLQPTTDVLTLDEMYDTMLFYSRRRSVISASSGGSGKDTENINGIVQGHAYAVVEVREIDGFRLLRLRNPWGTFEWQGPWGDKSDLWTKYPKVARALDFKPANDGAFWMDWKDFCAHFRNMDFCQRTTGWDDLRIDINEEHPCCGPVVGCLSGCATYWCCCQGCRALFCNKESRTFMKAPKGCCANCIQTC